MDKNQVITLINEAATYKECAYVPYSHFPVCAILIDRQGRKFFGVNVENASYGLTICAERNALCAAVTVGMTQIAVIFVVTDTLVPTTPCGACRQMLLEFSTPDTLVICANFHGNYTAYTMEQLLPFSFSAQNLTENTQK